MYLLWLQPLIKREPQYILLKKIGLQFQNFMICDLVQWLKLVVTVCNVAAILQCKYFINTNDNLNSLIRLHFFIAAQIVQPIWTALDGQLGQSGQINRNTATKISEVKLSAFIYRLFHQDFSSIVGINTVVLINSDDWGEIFMKQSVNKCRQINFWNLCA